MTTNLQYSGVEAVPATRTKHRRLILIVALVVILGVVAWVLRARSNSATAAAAGAASAENRAVSVLLAVVAKRDVSTFLDGLGNALPLATVTVKTQVDGRLDKMLFTEGQSVAKGDVLAQIDPRPFAIQLRQAQAALARDSSQLKNAELNLQRYTSLKGQNLIAQQQVDDQQAMSDQLRASVQSDQTQIDSARLQIDYARIKSPIDGVTGVRLVDPGNLVRATDATGIVVITQLDPMAVLFTLPQDDLNRVAHQMSLGGVEVDAYSRDGATRLATGKLVLIDNQINQATATVRLKATFPNPDRTLWPNEFLKVRIHLNTQKGVLVVPASVIQRGPQGTFAYVVAPDQTVSIRQVDVDSTQDQLSVVSHGLAEGDRVVVEGQSQLRPGAKVVARPEASARPGASARPAASAHPEGSAKAASEDRR